MRKCVLISLDALYDADLPRLKAHPFMRQLLEHAAVTTRVKTVFPALTYPAHVTLITGCDPAATGIGQNQPFQPNVPGKMRAWYWEAKNIRRPTLFDAVKQAGGRCSSILWPVTGKNPSIKWNFPEVLALPGENQTLKMLSYGSTGWILCTEVLYGKKRVSTSEPYLSDYATLLACKTIHHHKPDFLAVHLVDLDEARHRFGTHSPEAEAAIDRLAARVETIAREMQRTPGMENALLALVSDHGQADIHRTVNLSRLLEENGLQGSFGVQSCGMSAYFFPLTEKADAASLAECLRQNGEAYGIAHLYTRQEMDGMHCVPQVALAVEATPGVVFSDALDENKRQKATHGFGPGHPAENCLFAVAGRGIAPTALPEMPMRDVAPTLAALMGIDLSSADGTAHPVVEEKKERPAM